MNQEKHILRRRFGLLGLLVAVLIAGVGSFMAAKLYYAAVYVPDSISPDSPPVRRTQPKAVPRESPVAPTASTDSGQPPLVPVVERPVGTDADDESHFLLTVALEDPAGSALPDVEVGYRLLPPGGGVRRVASGTSDGRGEFPIAVPRGDSVWIEIHSDVWDCYPIERLPESDAVQRLILDPTRALTLTAMYDDGVPYTWATQVPPPSGSLTCDGYSAHFGFDDEGSVTVPKVRVSKPLTCTLYARRAGYDTYKELIDVDQLTSGAPINLIIPRSNKAGLLVLFDPPLSASSVLIVERGPEKGADTALRASLGAGSESWWSDTMYPGTRCRVTILGPQSSRSEWFTIERGKIYELRPELTTSGAARARIVDDAGLPVEGATLRISDREYLNIYNHSASKPLPGCVLADANGYAELAGLPPGEIQLEAEAPGREVEIRTIHVRANELTDMGTITLGPAIGAIEVRLVGADSKLAYRAILTQEGVNDLLLPRKFKNGKCRFEKLPLRHYGVTVFVAPGSPVRLASVELDAEMPAALVEIDVTGLKADD